MSEPDWRVRARIRRLIEASGGHPWLEPVAKAVFGVVLVAAVLFSLLMLLR